MRAFLGGILVTLLALVVGAWAVLYFGLFPMGANNPPGTLERRVAHMATDRYLERNAPTQPDPFPPTAANLTEGAQTYETHCAVCHGGAANKVSPLQNQFSPPVPQLVKRVPHDPPGEFWLVTKHGYRLTGMPAWEGILTDDQIWKVVLFIKHTDKLPPETLAAWRTAAGLPAKSN